MELTALTPMQLLSALEAAVTDAASASAEKPANRTMIPVGGGTLKQFDTRQTTEKRSALDAHRFIWLEHTNRSNAHHHQTSKERARTSSKAGLANENYC